MNTTTSQSLAGKVAIVTGASKGIGAAIARHLAAEGASVVVNYASSREGADRVVQQITDLGGKAVAVQASVAEPADVARLITESVAAFGKIDVLVNNAGVYEFSPLEAITVEHYHRQFNTNVLGLIQVSQAALPHFPAAGGSIINVSSVVTSVTPPASAVYTGTKGAVDAITGVLAKELAPRKIRVNGLNPGMVETEGSRSGGIIGSDFESNVVGQTPLGRVGQPDDIAKVAVFLASDASGWLTGEILRASGGMH